MKILKILKILKTLKISKIGSIFYDISHFSKSLSTGITFFFHYIYILFWFSTFHLRLQPASISTIFYESFYGEKWKKWKNERDVFKITTFSPESTFTPFARQRHARYPSFHHQPTAHLMCQHFQPSNWPQLLSNTLNFTIWEKNVCKRCKNSSKLVHFQWLWQTNSYDVINMTSQWRHQPPVTSLVSKDHSSSTHMAEKPSKWVSSLAHLFQKRTQQRLWKDQIL